jgi:hypothetical protein
MIDFAPEKVRVTSVVLGAVIPVESLFPPAAA